MLKGISSCISPELLKILNEMGHGDEIVLGDGNFPAESMEKNCCVVRADGIGIHALLKAILELMPLDQYDPVNFILMEVTPGDNYTPAIWEDYAAVLKDYEPNAIVTHIERFAFYERSKKAYAVVASGEAALYANIILKKGVVK